MKKCCIKISLYSRNYVKILDILGMIFNHHSFIKIYHETFDPVAMHILCIWIFISKYNFTIKGIRFLLRTCCKFPWWFSA